MADLKKTWMKIGIDVFLVVCTSLPILFFEVPFDRGFFCDDKSLMFPSTEQTVKSLFLYVFGFGIPIITIVATEIVRWKLKLDNEEDESNFPVWARNIYNYFGIFVFGVVCNKVITNLGKCSIGQLRPHFFDVCKPILFDGSTCSDSKNLNRYIEEFKCSNGNLTANLLRDLRFSFPSGHSSFSMYAMIFTALYLHCRFNWKGSKLMKHVLQLVFIMFAWFIALSRISDYQSHWSDVLVGMLQGLFVGVIVAYGISDLLNQTKKNVLPSKGAAEAETSVGNMPA